ncbi:MAG: hypothetical protein RI901_943, partial [Actinomycetota bacterium]
MLATGKNTKRAAVNIKEEANESMAACRPTVLNFKESNDSELNVK